MEENQVIRKLNWLYYGQMIIACLVWGVMDFAARKGMYVALDTMSQLGKIVQYVVIADAIITIPLGLYLIKWIKPQTNDKYFKCAGARILLVSNAMPVGVFAYYWMAGYGSMLWVAAMAAVALYFSKPTTDKMEQEMTPDDPNEPKY